MGFLEYVALSGLERVAIIVGAVVIGYWGYRLYSAEKKAGLAFMAMACLVLLGALVTGNSHVKSISEGMQMASAPLTPEAPEPVLLMTPESMTPEPVPQPLAVSADFDSPLPAEEAAPPAGEAVPAAPGPAPHSPTDTDATAATAPVPLPVRDDELNDTTPSSTTAESSDVPARIATGQELGGRIVSVKSETLSLEWSRESP